MSSDKRPEHRRQACKLPMPSDKCPGYWQRACRELSACDPIMANLIGRFKQSYLRGGKDAFTVLCRAVVGQQISVQAADSIWQRLETHFGTPQPQPPAIYRCHFKTLRRCGLSAQKGHYLKNIAHFFILQKITHRYWHRHTFEELQNTLLAIKGVGHWTFQMFAIFYLKYPDVLPLGDLGLLNAIYKEYNHGKKLTPKNLHKLAIRWKPWRTVATWYLWRSIDPHPVVY